MFALDSIADGLSLKWDGQLILEYHFQAGGNRTFIHPLRLPDSPSLSIDRAAAVPVDHLHHRGLWVAWKRVNGVNFWEQPERGEDPEGYGRIVHQDVTARSADVRQAHFAAKNAWVDWTGVRHLTETRGTTVYAPRDGAMVLDVSIDLHADERSVTLDLLRGDPGGFGIHYSGLALRLNDAMTPGELLDADGRTETADVYGNASRWCGFAGRHAEDGQVYGVTMIDHPENPHYPTRWWVRNGLEYGLLHPSPCFDEPLELEAGESVTLRYRIVLHKGPVRVARALIEEAAW